MMKLTDQKCHVQLVNPKVTTLVGNLPVKTRSKQGRAGGGVDGQTWMDGGCKIFLLWSFFDIFCLDYLNKPRNLKQLTHNCPKYISEFRI